MKTKVFTLRAPYTLIWNRPKDRKLFELWASHPRASASFIDHGSRVVIKILPLELYQLDLTNQWLIDQKRYKQRRRADIDRIRDVKMLDPDRKIKIDPKLIL